MTRFQLHVCDPSILAAGIPQAGYYAYGSLRNPYRTQSDAESAGRELVSRGYYAGWRVEPVERPESFCAAYERLFPIADDEALAGSAAP